MTENCRGLIIKGKWLDKIFAKKKVWEITSTIGYGETKSYGEIAEIMGSKAYRAIGSALGANPLPIVIPCHRVKAKASIGGYSGGLDKKRILLSIEGIKA